MKLLKLKIFILLAVSILAHGYSTGNEVDQENSSRQYKQRILVLNSYSYGNPWTDSIVRAIRNEFKDDPNVVINIEYMDTKMISTAEHFELLRQIYKNKYAKHTIDVIISSDDDALQFLRKYREVLFPGVPVVFCGVNNFSHSKVKSFDNYTGINETSDNIANFELILKLHPNVKTLYVISGNLTTDRSLRTEFFEAIKEYEDRFDLEILSDFSLQNLINRVSLLEKDSVIYYLSFFRDNTGRSFKPHEVIPYIVKASPVPVYGSVDYMLGLGIVGGKLKSGYFQGRSAAYAAKKILLGVSAENIPIVMQNTGAYMFDYHQLQRFDIKISDLPGGGTIINQP